MLPVSKCVCVRARAHVRVNASVCVHSVSAQACVHIGACVSGTFLPVKLVRHLMIVMHLLEESSSLFFFSVLIFCSYVESDTLIFQDLLNTVLDVCLFDTVTSHGGDDIPQ